MLILAVDTTTPAGSVALLENRRLLAEIDTAAGLSHSENLLPSVEFLLRRLKRDVGDIDGWAAAVGPGSFTGIRVGLSTIKALACASGLPIAPVSALEALAWKLKTAGTRLLCPVMDAKKGEVYAALFESRAGRLQQIIPQGAYKPDALLSQIPSRRIISFLGAGAEVYREKILEYFNDRARFPHRSPFIAYEVGYLGYPVLKEGKGRNFLDIEPLYFRRSQAEEK